MTPLFSLIAAIAAFFLPLFPSIASRCMLCVVVCGLLIMRLTMHSSIHAASPLAAAFSCRLPLHPLLFHYHSSPCSLATYLRSRERGGAPGQASHLLSFPLASYTTTGTFS